MGYWWYTLYYMDFVSCSGFCVSQYGCSKLFLLFYGYPISAKRIFCQQDGRSLSKYCWYKVITTGFNFNLIHLGNICKFISTIVKIQTTKPFQLFSAFKKNYFPHGFLSDTWTIARLWDVPPSSITWKCCNLIPSATKLWSESLSASNTKTWQDGS